MYTNAAAVRDYIGEQGASNEALITSLIARAQAAIDTHVGYTFEAVSAARYFDTPDSNELELDYFMSLTTITNGDGSNIPVSEVRTYPANLTPKNRIKIKASSAYSFVTNGGDPEQAIEITATWGYSDAAPDDIVQACTRWAAYMYRQRDAQVFDTIAQPEAGVITIPQGIPADVKMLLAPYRRIV